MNSKFCEYIDDNIDNIDGTVWTKDILCLSIISNIELFIVQKFLYKKTVLWLKAQNFKVDRKEDVWAREVCKDDYCLTSWE